MNSLIKEIDSDDEVRVPLVVRIAAVAKALKAEKEALRIRVRTKALKDILTRDAMMAPLTDRQAEYLKYAYNQSTPPRFPTAYDEALENCQEVLNVGVY